MGLRDRLRRLQRLADVNVVLIPQMGGSARRFPERELAPAYLDALDRAVGRSSPDASEHPLCAAARNSSDPKWRNSWLVTDWQEPPPDLSEQGGVE